MRSLVNRLPGLAFLLLAFVSPLYSLRVVVFLPTFPEEVTGGLERLAQELAFQNHEVITFRLLPRPEKRYLVMHRLYNVDEMKLQLNLSANFLQELSNIGDSQVWHEEYGSSNIFKSLWKVMVEACRQLLDSDLLENLSLANIDVAIVPSDDPCILGIVRSLSVPFVYFDLTGFDDQTLLASGICLNSVAQIPSSRGGRRTNHILGGAIQNAYDFAFAFLAFHLTWLKYFGPAELRHLHYPVLRLFQEHEKYSSKFKSTASTFQIVQEASMFMVNSDFLIEPSSRKLPSNLIYVGGFHQETARPLLKPYSDRVAAAKNGLIVVSFGNWINPSSMPESMAKLFLNVFTKLPEYCIFWRMKRPLIDVVQSMEIPPNVNVTQYIPQVDLLNDKSAKLFISHGGALSSMEAVIAGVPVLGIPLMAPNYNTLRKLKLRQMAVVLDKERLTESVLLKTIRSMLNDQKEICLLIRLRLPSRIEIWKNLHNLRYSLAAKKVSKMFHQRPVQPIDHALHWIEFVGRYKRSSFSTHFNCPINIVLSLLCSITFTLAAALASWLFYLWSFGSVLRDNQQDCKIKTK